MLPSIPFDELIVKPAHLWGHQWLLLTCGDFAAGQFNCMTVGWGSLGRLWNRPYAQIFVRPSRYTYTFLEKYDTFTLCAFPPAFHDALDLLGTQSGRDGNKIAKAGLTPIASNRISSPGFAEASLILECKTIYWDDLKPAQFKAGHIQSNYPQGDYHRIYFGEMLAAYGEYTFRSTP